MFGKTSGNIRRQACVIPGRTFAVLENVNEQLRHDPSYRKVFANLEWLPQRAVPRSNQNLETPVDRMQRFEREGTTGGSTFARELTLTSYGGPSFAGRSPDAA